MSAPKKTKKPRTKRLPKSKTYTDFVLAWQAASTVSEAADNIGITEYDASHIASYLRKKGVKLQNFRRPSTNYADLAKLAQDAAPKGN